MVIGKAGIEIPQPSACDVFIATMGDRARKKGFAIVKELRDKGIAADMDHCARSLKAQFKYADKIKAGKVIILGEEELDSGACQIKNMRASSDEEKQREIKISDIVKELC